MDDALRAAELFAAAEVAVLGTIAADGTPRLVPVTFAAAADRVVIAIDHKPKSTRRLARLTDIEADPRVTLLAQHYSPHWSELWWVRASGTAVISSDEESVAEVGALLGAKYPQYRDHPPTGPIIDINVTRYKEWRATSP